MTEREGQGVRIGPDEPALPVHNGAVVTVGTFDGVHRGHVDVLARLVARSRALDLPSVVITFDPHPLEVVNPAAAPPLPYSKVLAAGPEAMAFRGDEARAAGYERLRRALAERGRPEGRVGYSILLYRLPEERTPTP